VRVGSSAGLVVAGPKIHRSARLIESVLDLESITDIRTLRPLLQA
jgi:hypothetical protein